MGRILHIHLSVLCASGSLGGALHNLGGTGAGVDHTNGVCLGEDSVERAEGEESAALIETGTIVGRCFEVGGVVADAFGTVIE